MINQENRMKKTSIIISIIIIWFIYAVYMYANSMRTIDSDMSTMVLMASDILHGNVFLRGWRFSGATFLTTDMLFFIFGVIVSGTDVTAYVIAISTMTIALAFLGSFLLQSKRRISWNSVILLITYLTISGSHALYLRNVHTACFAWGFGALVCIDKALLSNYNSKKYWLLMAGAAVFIIMGMAGSVLMLFSSVIPLVIYFIFILIKDFNIHMKNWNLSTKTIIGLISIIVATVVGMILQKLYLNIGGAELNAFTGDLVFTDVGEYSTKVALIFKTLQMLVGADYNAQKVLSLQSLVYMARMLLLVFSLYIILRNIYDFCKNKNLDFIDITISISFLLSVLICLVTNRFYNIFHGRYFCYTPFVQAIVVIRYYQKHPIREETFRRFGKYAKHFALIGLLGTLLIGEPHNLTLTRDNANFTNLITFLESNDLHNGYAEYWHASAITISSKGEVCIRPIAVDNDKLIMPYPAFIQSDWYDEPANFIITNPTEENGFYVQKDSVFESFGLATQILTFEDYIIYVYDHDIHSLLQPGYRGAGYGNGNDDVLITSADETIWFCSAQRNAEDFVVSGLSYDEDTFAWTDGTALRMNVSLPDSPALADYRLSLSVQDTFTAPQRVRVESNGITIWTSSISTAGTYTFTIPNVTRGNIDLTFNFPDAVSPHSIGVSTDERVLSLALVYATIECLEPTDHQE